MTKTINEIVEQRKQFVSRAYNFLNQHQDILDELKSSIMDEMTDDLQSESLAMKKWVDQSNSLDKFNRDMKESMRKQTDGEKFSHHKIIEINYMRNYYQQQINNSKKHYAISLTNLSRKKKLWRLDSAEYMKRTINLNTDYKNQKNEIDEHLPQLKDYTQQWNQDTIESLKDLIDEATDLIKFCSVLLSEISLAKSTESVDMISNSSYINQISAQKNSVVMRSCEELSLKLKNFATKHNFENLSKKLNLSFFTIKDFILDSMQDGPGSGMRASIRIMKKMSQVEVKIADIVNKLESLRVMFGPKYESLKDRKSKMIKMCVLSDQLEESTIYRWIDVNFANIFTPIDEKVQKLNSN